ncbi:MAG: iron-containing alcohol dehydrogenase [Coriobacteriia bacterium]|nr:iron-containing alcohol dehydrogenase [Coriobacteriia bacterium]
MIPAYYEFANTAKVLSGEGAIENIPFELRNLRCTRALVITNTQLRGLGLVDIVLRALADGDIEVGVLFDDVPVDSSVTVVNAVATAFRDNRCDCLVAVGGGSVLDTAKGASIVLSAGETDLLKVRGVDRLVGRFMTPFVAVPTTAGTGSEVTGAAVIKDTKRHVKMGFASFNLVPDVAVLDPRMSLGLPQRLTASTGMDALTHAVEAFSCRQANPLSDGYARTAIDLVREYLPLAVNEPRDAKARLGMANAALLAGVSFSNAMVGIVHALGHACGGVADVPHGDAMAVLLPYGMEYNMDVAGPRYGELLLHLAGPDVYARTPKAERPAAAVAAVRALLDWLHERSGQPVTLTECGVTEKQLAKIAKVAADDGAISMNPKDASVDDLLGVLKAAL